MCLFKKHKPYITKEGYKQIYKKKYPGARTNGYVPEHQYVAEKMIGRPLNSDEIVHHINGIKTDNRKKNLQVMTRSEHYKIHHQN